MLTLSNVNNLKKKKVNNVNLLINCENSSSFYHKAESDNTPLKIQIQRLWLLYIYN